jgi:hypothetical protein
LSVLITSYDSPGVLRQSLASLVAQPEVDEIVVADCSPVNPETEFAADFPGVRFVRSPGRKRVPELRWGALAEVQGEIVGALESRCVPAPDWGRRMLREHAAHPETPVVGGPVAPGPSRAAFDLGLYFCEYGAFAPPVREGPAAALSGANLCYKRAALEQNRDLLDTGAWETFLHERWLAQGRQPRLCGATITFHNTMTPGVALRQRYHYGRGYAAERAIYQAGARRLLYVAASPLLPLLLSVRLARQALSKGMGCAFARALGWVLALNLAWSAGEAVGYLLGADPEPRIF